MHPIVAKILAHNKEHKLRFDAEKHQYQMYTDFILTSVTRKISRFFPFDKEAALEAVAAKFSVTEEEVQASWDKIRDRGTYIHDLAERYCMAEELSTDELSEIENVVKFFEDHPEFEVAGAEVKVFSKKYYVGGTIDCILIDSKTGKLVLLDWKTSAKDIEKTQYYSMALPPFNTFPNNKFYSYSLQINSYAHILDQEYGIGISELLIVHLKDDGSYAIIEPILCDAEVEQMLSMKKSDMNQ